MQQAELDKLGNLFIQQPEVDRTNWVQTNIDNFLVQFEDTIPNAGDAGQVSGNHALNSLHILSRLHAAFSGTRLSVPVQLRTSQ